MDKSTINVLVLSFSFLFVLTGFNTGSLIQKTVVEGINKEFNVGWDGFYGLCILYAVFSVSNFFAPSILTLFGPRVCLFFSACTYLLYVVTFLYPVKYALNLVSVVIGIGAAVIWTAQGTEMTKNSNKETLDRNTGIFWAIFQGSLLFGNLFVFFEFRGVTEITTPTRLVTYTVLSVVCGLGVLLLLALRPASRPKIESVSEIEDASPNDSGLDENSDESEAPVISQPIQPLEQLKSCFKLLRSSKILLLCCVFFYSGLILSFYSGVYVTAVGSTNSFGNDSSKLIGLCGMLIGVGEIVAGGLFGLMGKRFNRHGRSPIIFLGFVVHIVAFFLTFLNLPDYSTVGKTDQISYLGSSVSVALFCAFLYGFGDACVNTQIYSIIGSLFPPESQMTSSAFALYKFTQSISAALSFFYSQSGLRLFVHLIILVSTATLSTLSFFLVENRFKVSQA